MSTKHKGTVGAEIHVTWQQSIEDLGSLLFSLIDVDRQVGVVPSSLNRSDQRLASLRAALRERQLGFRVLVPRSPASLATSMVSRHGTPAWISVQSDGRSWRIDSRLAVSPWLAFTVVDEVAKTGPFVLDLPSRFLHPLDRVKLLARSDRQRVVAAIAAPTLPSACLICTPVADGWLAVMTTDPIAAELWALALAERYFDQRMEMQGPWEDDVVQHATELELGVRIPGQIGLHRIGDVPLPDDANALLVRAGHRLGMRIA